MKKHLLVGYFVRKIPSLVLSLTLLLFYSNSKAQSFIPYYDFTPTISTPYVPITTGTVLTTGNSDDGTYMSIPLGFTFVYDGNSYTTVSVTDNGYLRFGGTITGYDRNMITDNVPNGVTPISADLEGSGSGELRWDTFGLAPNRKFVVQWKNWSFYSNNGDDTLNFQIVLHESSNAIDFIYGHFAMLNEVRVQVGITGNTGYDYLSRTTDPDDDWNATLEAGSPWDDCKLSPLGPVVPFNSLTYTFTPPPKVYTFSLTENASTLGVAPGSVTQAVARLKLRVDGIGSYLPVTSLTVNTTGTTSLANISNLNVYYTGLSSNFSTAQQFGSTIFGPTATNNIITDSFNMEPGEHYFWVTYDISASATLGNAVDAEISSVTVGNVAYTPLVTAPAGNRIIMNPMTYVSSQVTQNNLSKAAIGSENNEIIGIQVVMSSTGATAKATQLDFDVTGTTDTADIRNMKVWYTGNSSSFATNNQFGSTLAFLPGSSLFTITGDQSLFNDTNYFWLTYDINDTGTLANVIDGSCNSIMISGVSQFPLVSSPTGNRELRNDYCTPLVSNAVNSCNWGYYISNVTTNGAVSNISNYSGCNGNSNNHIIYNNQSLVVKQNQTVNIELGDYSSWLTYAVWIDFNQDGVYDNITERVFQGSTIQNEGYVTGDFTIPCDALPGTTRMRVRGGDYWWWGAPIGDPCSDVGYGETEEYNVVILNNPVMVASLEPNQNTGVASPGTLDKVILQIPVETEGCGTAVNTEMRFSTTGTTAVGDIATAKLYRTAKASFNTSNLLGTIASPSGQFSFTLSDTLELGTSFYWLTYDISSSAVLSNVVDARLDSIQALGSYHKPTVGNPSGNVQVIAPMTYVSSTATQNLTEKVGRGSENNEIIGVQVVTSAIGAPIKVTQLDFDVTGTTDTVDLRNMKVWYTGTSNSFDANTQFGATLDFLPGATTFSIAGDQSLSNGTNYFWLTYDINDTAVLGNVVDGSATGVTVNGTLQIPTVTSPTGNREVREEYCTALAGSTNSCNWGYYISNVTTSGADNDISNYSGCNGNANNYIHYTGPTLVTKPNQTINITLGDYSSWVTYSIWIDYNQDGIFTTNERVFQGPTTQNEGYANGSFTIPCDALPGNTRMRVRGGDFWNLSAPISSACADIWLGETEDYNVVILPNPIAIVSVEPDQQAAIAAPGATDKVILSIPVATEGCGTAVNTEMRFSTTGTTAVANILNAKLYRTADPNFNNNNLLGTVTSPSGQFMFTLNDTMVTSGTTFYWLTYDISSSATLTNVVDARFDSLLSLGDYQVPLNGNPTGNIQITAPMTYLASTVEQETQKVSRGTANNPVIAVKVTTSATGAPISLTQFNFDAAGSTDTADIRNIKVWYTADDDDFTDKVQFGTTIDFLPGTTVFSITGTQELVNGDNYFWLSYDINDTALLGNVVDGSCSSINIGVASHTPTTISPAGTREIREKYCEGIVSQATNSCNWGYYISNVTTSGAEDDISNYSGCNGNPNNYIYYSSETLVAKQSQTINIELGDYSSWITYAVWIDYNQDGVFDNTTELAFQGSTVQNEPYVNGSFTIPCDALPGTTRMRVRGGDYWWFGAPIGTSCGDIGYGETEDYNIEILANPVQLAEAEPVQQTGSAAAGDVDKPVLKIPMVSEGCGDGIVTQVNFATTGTTNASDILAAKLYRTDGSATFNASNLLGTAFSPSGAFSFTISDTLLPNTTTYYWLAYDINGSATTSNVVDARLDSVEAVGEWYIPSAGAPSGNIQITTPMTVVGTNVAQPNTLKVGQGEKNNGIIRMMVITSATGAPVNATQFDFSSNGTTDTADIRNMKVWYTGDDPKFAANTQFGSTLSFLPGTTIFSISGTQPLLNDTNYFWLTYDINDTALIGNVVDGECLSMSVAGSIHTPTVSAPAGSREIRMKYCDPIVSNVANSCNWGYFINAVNTYGAVQNISNYTGCNGGTNNYIYYDNQTMVVTGGQTITMDLGDYMNYTTYSVWIDYNQDGTFDISERVVRTPNTGNYGNTNVSFVIPAGALTGVTRMRIRTADYWWWGSYINSPCTDVGIGETEDYNVEILPMPAPATYVWNQTSLADFNDPSNWTPARNTTYMSDKLVFNSGGTVNVEYMPTQTVSSIEVNNNTVVNMIAYSKSTLSVLDSLNLVSGKIVGDANIVIGVGVDTTLLGTITGTGSVEASIKRWINSTTTTLDFPLSNDTNNNAVSLSYTTAPIGGAITARLVTGPTSQAGLPLVDGTVTINKVSPYTVWRLTASNGYSGGVFDGTFNAEGVTYVTNPADLRITRRLASIAAWTLDGTAVSGTGTIAAPILGRTGMTLLGEFGIGGEISVNPLPVTLVSLKASAVKENVLVTWTTATEINNQGFVVERSVDGKTFTKVDFVKGMGSSTKAVDYSLTDAKAFTTAQSNTLYYRLRQVDYNGTEHISSVVRVTRSEKVVSSITAYPNPSNTTFTIEMVSTESANYSYAIMDIQGKVVAQSRFEAVEGLNKFTLENTDALTPGIYFLRINGPESTTIKLVKTH